MYGELVDLLVDTGASNSFAPCRLVQALQLPIAECKKTQISTLDGSQLTSSPVCKVPVWLNAICCINMHFLVVDMQLSFILGMDLLKCALAKVDLVARNLTLCSDDSIVATLKGICKWSNLLPAELLAYMSSFESYGFDNVFQCSVKQAKKLVKDPKVLVFVAIV